MVPILLFGSQEDRRLPELSYSTKGSRCAGGEGVGGGGGGGNESLGGGLLKRGQES